MLPLWLHMENFGSFRAPATLDLSGAGYFALVGPTGAGKSTIIDAICFALYGRVPRWGAANVVSLALPPSAAVGRVGLVFEAGGRRYGAVRVLARNRRGQVSTREARLDELGAADNGSPYSIARGARPLELVLRSIAEGEDVARHVQRITGLPYRYFVRSVVVPQGRFAEFLHAPPGERQELLMALLDAGIYERIRQRAAVEEEAGRRAAALAAEQLAELTGADLSTERAAERRLEDLTDAAEAISAALADLIGYEEELRDATAELAAARRTAGALAALKPPDGLTRLAGALTSAADDLAAGTDLTRRSEEEENATAHELAEAGDPEQPQRLRTAHVEHTKLSDDLLRTGNRLMEASERVSAIATDLADADAADAIAAAELDRAKSADVAAAIAAGLGPGDPCPVCLRPIGEPPRHEAIADIDELERRTEDTAREMARLEAAHRDAELGLGRLEQTHHDLTARVEALAAVVAAAPDLAAIEQRLKVIATARENAERARAEAAAARAARDAARHRLDAARDAAGAAWRAFGEARDTVADLGPPFRAGDDPAAGWRSLLTWRDETAARQDEEVAALAEGLEWTRASADQLRTSIVDRLAAVGVPVPAGSPPQRMTEVVIGAVEAARGDLERIRDARRRAAALRSRAAGAEREAQVAHDLALALRANNFGRWLTAEALDLLLGAASEVLGELSGGQFALALGDRDDIEIIDYGEAGLRRSVRTLSGGETFQTGLALALALAERVGDLSANPSHSLDAIFLDEGFGTLDASALDTVAATLERLSGGGQRMVGVVTHVPALAERIPVRFEVARDATGSHVRRTTP